MLRGKHHHPNKETYALGTDGFLRNNTLADTWTPLAPLSISASGRAAATLDGKIYFSGGYLCNKLDIYDIKPTPGQTALRCPMPLVLPNVCVGSRLNLSPFINTM